MGAFHSYTTAITWTGAGTEGTASYTSYSRDHLVGAEGKPDILASADPAFRGDPARHNPEELFVASLSQCHMLWFLHMAAVAGVVVRSYTDTAVGTMRVESAGAGQFTEIELRPRVIIDDDDAPDRDARIAELHERAHAHCFISRSVNFPVRIIPAVRPAVAAAHAGHPFR
ncbi:Organic hydroperoxide reductase OsmC/OhrA [Sanguibacter gelidistatuariae]|uniref:Organic hydroperoxide reductase OsmC/OhrA n=1 Tax=Sanguibacter gelidistatuariae TaxID=1814289 RepID=A0A1G6T7L1_9MICO|nr:OsmC family protein [Sanguibacter gelidistatuariae]SDD25092.1 Organic hydroperoxide reductase OsmC/OhrA [Sanguibacter gelidistatuariae]